MAGTYELFVCCKIEVVNLDDWLNSAVIAIDPMLDEDKNLEVELFDADERLLSPDIIGKD